MNNNFITYIPFIVFGIVIAIVRLITRKYPKAKKLNDRLNKKYANHQNGLTINPATGLPMINNSIDVNGNFYGTRSNNNDD